MTYPIEFRQRVFDIQNRDELTNVETSRLFGIAVSTLARWRSNIEPKPTKDRPAIKLDMDELVKDLQEDADAYLHERADRFGVTTVCIFYAIKRLGMSRKKLTHIRRQTQISSKSSKIK